MKTSLARRISCDQNHILTSGSKILKKLKDIKLKALYKAEADKLLTDPYAGEAKTSTERFDFFKTAAEMEKKLVERFF